MLAKTEPNKFWSEIRKFRKRNDKNNIPLNDFYEHFKNLFSNDDIFENIQVESQLNDQSFDVNVEELDQSICTEEVVKAIESLKRGKSGGSDLLIPEIFIECKEMLSPILCKLFNYMFDNSIYPESWTNGIIVPVPKKGNVDDVNNYRGITLTSIFSKLFSIILDTRLRKWAESNDILNDFQFGFRNGKSAIDCIFILQSIINKTIKCDKRKLYCAFIDFRKAFDLVYRNGIWVKLINCGVSSKIIKMFQRIYQTVKSCVRVNGSLSESFESYMGVKQGEPLSPLLFIFFINDMYAALYDEQLEHFTIDEIQLFLLLFADDTVLFSYTKEGLQSLLDKLSDYCKQWNIHVNINKTVVMVCHAGNRNLNVDIFYDGEKLKVVQQFTYLGVTLSSNGNFYKTQKSLAEQSMRAIFALMSVFENVSLNISDKIKLFDSMITPIMNYGSQVWGFHKGPDLERVHVKFLKQILGVRPQTPNVAVYGELGRFPLAVVRKVNIIKHWYRILKSPDTLLFKLFDMRDSNGAHINHWSLQVKQLLMDLGFNYLWEINDVNNLQINMVIQRIYDQYLQHWYSETSSSTKLETYALIKPAFEFEKYLDCVQNNNHRIALTRLRCSAHKLNIEEGRHRNIDRNNRLCNKCNMKAIESEYHFVLVCPFYREIRQKCFSTYFCSWPSIHKFKRLMSSTQRSNILKLAKYVYVALSKRQHSR